MNAISLAHPDDWVYVQLFLPAALDTARLSPSADAILRDDLSSLFSAFGEQGHTWFFIRYLEGGYHLRLRVHAALPGQREALGRKLCAALGPACARGATLRFAAYEPEIDKYCGPKGNHLAEHHFCASSATALQVMADDRLSWSERGLRLLAATLEAAGLEPVRSHAWCRAYYDYWWRAAGSPAACRDDDEHLFQRSQAAIRAKLEPDAGAVAAWLETWRRALAQVLPAMQALEDAGELTEPIRTRDAGHRHYRHPQTQLSVLPNFWHMLCNRLGLSVRQEMRLTYCLMRHLATRHGIDSFPLTMSLIPDPS
jgi:thiopeptide-type bacteriocin biosynthesis protein